MTKKKTFNQLVPKWSKKLKRGYDSANHPCIVDGQTLDIAQYSQCIVGEAYKFTENPTTHNGYSVYDDEDNELYCEVCEGFASSFAHILGDLGWNEREKNKEALKYFEEKFEEQKKRFVEHFNEDHIDLEVETE